ncbi:MAG: LysM peptidoglycan-binding domain-containing protein [Lachnospiraceae bacterium]|nr:LysM peptidoglycan-binding domain-containing protein [Lachnospiraceae bacterium]
MGYVVYFEFDNEPYRLPVNPEEINETSVQAVGKYEILELGQIVVPTHMELRKFSFEVEFPHKEYHYINKPDEFKSAYSFLKILKENRDNLLPIRFVFGPDGKEEGEADRTGDSVMVLIEELSITEKAGEEGDKYVSFQLLEYREFGKRPAIVDVEETSPSSGTTKKAKKKKVPKEETNPKSTGTYVVKSGDTLWGIAKKYYGDGTKCNRIYNANKDKIKNPAVIHIGWKLKIPSTNEFSKYSAPLPKAVKKEPELPKYTGGVSSSGRTHSSGGGRL